ncbi:MAG: hypothetical protein L0J74_00170 [Corynebacterium sp.]|uniref:hypothetical protein n=2 Tax=Corynebacterium sp. TaxID=1720 RepID=UPI00264A1D24|nr:hypothetical protein [Corynebacterium sp.]MDN6304218.1 hypothetical protein [Corynebacterium sp.]MDN6394804.1 hypothetical protein [Corynebacterium sp.]
MNTTGDTGDTGDGDHNDLHTLGETIVAAIADEIQHEEEARELEAKRTGVAAAEKYTLAQAQVRFAAWQKLDLDQVPDAVWSALTLGAHSVFEAIEESTEHDRAFNIEVIDDPYNDSRRVLFITLLHTNDSDAGMNGESAPVHGDTIIVMVPDQDALTQITELLSQDPELLQGWWIGALQEYAAVADMPPEIIETILMRTIMTAIHYPFPDASGRIRCPHGVDFEVVDTAAQEAAVADVREKWAADRGIDDPDVILSLGNLATWILEHTLERFGREGLISGYSFEDDGIKIAMLTDAERDAGLPGVELVTAPADRRLLGRLRHASRSRTSSNAAWSRALLGAAHQVEQISTHTREDIMHVIERSAMMLAEEELAVR